MKTKMTNFFRGIVNRLAASSNNYNNDMYRYYKNEYGKDGARLYAEFLKTGRVR